MSTQSVYVILVNWNGWSDTIECLESLFRSTYKGFNVVVCDNNSGDGSVDRILGWAAGDVTPPCASNPALEHLSCPPVPKPLTVGRIRSNAKTFPISVSNPKLALIEIPINLGFAGANNLGMRYALSQHDAAFLWLLNNDTVVNPDALEQMVKYMQQNPDVGILGSKLIFYNNEKQVQALGGARYNPWIARGTGIGAFTSPSRRSNVLKVSAEMDYVIGASMFVSDSFVQAIGPLNEEYFLYFEELDWALRAKGRFRLSFCESCVVYHKNGASTHGNTPSKPSLIADYYSTRNKIRITRRYYLPCLPSVYGYLLIRAMKRLIQGAYKNAYIIARLILGLGDFLSEEDLREWLNSDH